MIIGSTLSFYNGSSYEDLPYTINKEVEYTFDVWFNYIFDIFMLDVYADGFFIDRTIDNLPYTGKKGLSSIRYIALVTGGNEDQGFFIDTCGIYYHHFGPDSDELGFLNFDLNTDSNLNMEKFNLLTIKAYSEFWISATSGEFTTAGQIIRTFRSSGWNEYFGDLEVINNYNVHVAEVSNPSIVIWMDHSNLNISYFKLSGARLYNDSFSTHLEYDATWSKIADDEGYYYVDGDRLKFNIVTDFRIRVYS